MTLQNALRFLDHEARRCRDRDAHEALCLLLPAILKTLRLEPMDDFQALDFQLKFRAALKETVEPGNYVIEAACVDCGAGAGLRIAEFEDGAARTWCERCGRETVFTIRQSA